jgi:hypothetical protein
MDVRNIAIWTRRVSNSDFDMFRLRTR